MVRKRNFLKNNRGSVVLETIIAVGVALSLLTVFYYSADSLYTVENEPGSELQAISTGVSETLINSPGQDSNGNPGWDISGEIDVLGLSTSLTVEYGTMLDTTDKEGKHVARIIDGPYSDGGSIGESKACFLSGTKVVMSDESCRSIEDILVGDFVKSYDEMNGEIVDREVVDVFHHGPDEMGDHYLVINGQLRVTPNHRFFIDGEWIFASELVIGDRLFYPSTDYMVFSLEKVFERVFTYNFEVEGNHNYFVMMDPTSVLVHNADTPYAMDVELSVIDPVSQEGYVPLTVEFKGKVTHPGPPIKPYHYYWDFDGDGEWDDDYETYYNPKTDVFYTYESSGSYTVKMQIESSCTPKGVGIETTVINVLSIPEGYFSPVAKFIWFDADGPYQGGDGTKICFNASSSLIWDDDDGNEDKKYRWSSNGVSLHIGQNYLTTPVHTYDWYDVNPHKVKLEVEDAIGEKAYYEDFVRANNPDPVELDTKPWVLAGKEIWPEYNGFSSYPSDYYVRYRMLEGKFKLYEVKEKTISDQPILSHEKIICLSKGSYDEKYNDIKDALGLGSDLVYNFRLEITIYNDNGSVDEQMFFGASDDTASVKESTTRQVLVYYPPGAVSVEDPYTAEGYSWVIDDHPMYKQAEITIYVFLGGTAPEPP